jgi:hypothetical protein
MQLVIRQMVLDEIEAVHCFCLCSLVRELREKVSMKLSLPSTLLTGTVTLPIGRTYRYCHERY